MRFVGAMAAAAAAAVVCLSASPAAAAGDTTEATGEVVVFSSELLPLDRFDVTDTGCQALPPATHVVSNLSDQDVAVYSDPYCTMPMMTLKPGWGTHASGAGSFKPAA